MPLDPIDPCDEAERLRRRRTAILAGEHETSIRTGDEEVRFGTKIDMGSLDREIARYEALCAEQTGVLPVVRRTRFARRSTFRPY